jgi:AcrR family transcriptional regulator
MSVKNMEPRVVLARQPMTTARKARRRRPPRPKSTGDRRKDNGANTQARLRAAGWKLFGTVGYRSTAVGALCSEAGVTTGALYHHFGDKQGLFAAVAEELDRSLVERSGAATAAAVAAGKTAREGFFAAVDAFLASGVDPRGRRIGLVDAPAVLGADGWLAIRDRHGLAAMTRSVVGLQALGLAPQGQPRRLARIILGLLMGAVEALPRSPAAAKAALPETRKLVHRFLDNLLG